MNESKKKRVLRNLKSAIKRNKRQKKIDDLQNSDQWPGLESKCADDCINEDVNKFIFGFRRLYLSGRLMTFREWIGEMNNPLDELDR